MNHLSSLSLPVLFGATCVVLGAFPAAVEAAGIVYTFSGNATGTIGAQSFNGAAFSLVVTADTANITFTPSPQLWSVPAETATITVAGVGTATISSPVLVGNSGSAVALMRPGVGSHDIMDLFAPGLGSYGLNTAFGPVTATGPGSILMEWGWQPVNSNLGVINLTGVGPGATFRAAVPAPGAVVPLALAAGVCLRRRRATPL